MDKALLVHEIKKINGDILKHISNRYRKMNYDITPIHAKILITLYNSDKFLCQKDLEEPISCNKSTMSFIISTMEKNGLLSRSISETDSRINYLLLTKRGLELVEILKKDKKYIEEILSDNISDDEYEIFMLVIGKIRKNMERV